MKKPTCIKTQDTYIIQHLKNGDVSAFEFIYKNYYKGLCAFAANYGLDIEDCEEIVQDTMMWLWENHETIIPEMSLKSLLFTIVKNKSLNAISHRDIKQSIISKLQKKLESKFENPDFYLSNELEVLLNKSIKELPDDYREAFIMNRFKRMTYYQIAEETGFSAKTIAYRISQALKILRVKLKDFL